MEALHRTGEPTVPGGTLARGGFGARQPRKMRAYPTTTSLECAFMALWRALYPRS
ncbi:MAG: hypothetical protein ACLU7P_14670 [Eggerthella lenta]